MSDPETPPEDPRALLDFFTELEERLSFEVRTELKLSALLVSIPGALDVYQTSLLTGYLAAREALGAVREERQ